MKTIKPDDMAVMFKTQVLNNKDIFTVSAFAVFNFDTKAPRLLDESSWWEVVDASLDQDEILDFGSPKPRGEFLVYGSCFSAIPVTGLGVQVSVDNLSKTLVIMGDRCWGKLGVSEITPFTTMPINYRHAFGGNGYASNPLGKGFSPNVDGTIELPNVEDPKNPITQKSDLPEPVGFTAYQFMWPQRMQYMGNVNDNYVKDSWPHMPQGTNPEYFNTAPADQRLKGFFRGDEIFSIKNMHKEKPVLNSKLPGLRARIFVVQKLNDTEEKFKELDVKIDTLWLFPNYEVGALLYRANVEVSDDEYTDLDKLYAIWENMDEKPKPAEYYFTQMMNTLNPPEDNPEAAVKIIPELQAEQKVVSPVVDMPNVDVSQFAKADSEVEKLLQEMKNFQIQMKDKLKKMNAANPDLVIEQQAAKLASMPETSTEMANVLKQMEGQNANLMQKFNVSQDDIARVITKTNTQPPSPPPIQEMIDKMRKAGVNDPEFEAKLIELDKLSKDIKAQAASMNKVVPETKAKALETEMPKSEKLVEEETRESDTQPILSAKELTREEVVERYKINKELIGLDLTGLDLSGLDLSQAVFSNSILDSTLFKQTKLDQAVFNDCRLCETDFTDSSLKSALFNQGSGELVKFNNADLSLAIFSNINFNECSFNSANLQELGINHSTFEAGNFERVQAFKLTADQATFTLCDLTNADFSKANLINSEMSYCIVDDANFNQLYAPELKLNGMAGTSTCFKNAYLIKTVADEETILHKADFRDAVLTDAAWEGVKLPQTNLSGANMDNGNFSKGDFSESSLELASAKNTDFSKAVFINSDLNRINLFQGSLRKASLGGTNLAYSNLFGVDVYKAKFGNTNLIGANLNRTLFGVFGINVDSI